MPDVVYLGPSDNLLLKDGGRVYHPGDTIRLSAEALGNLTLQGMRFAHAHSEEEAAAIEAMVHPPAYVPPVELVTGGPDIAAPAAEHGTEPRVVNLAPDPEPEPEPVPAAHSRRSSSKESS